MSISVSCGTPCMISFAVMILIGLTGGVATGKSTVAQMFKKRGAVVIDADELAHAMVQPGKPAWQEIVQVFGKQILNPDRSINRQVLSSIVFSRPAKRRRLERIIHPRVAREQQRLTRAAATQNPNAVVIYDVPLLFEAGIDTRVDKIVVVAADQKTQIARLRKRNGLSQAEALRRIRSQIPMQKKCRLADIVLDGAKEKRLLAQDVAKVYTILSRCNGSLPS